MKTLYHPTMPDTSVEVADSDVNAWTEQGWRKTDPSKTKPRTSQTGEDDTPKEG